MPDFVGIGMLVTTVGAALSLVLKSLFQSRCTKIECCCFGCERNPLNPGESVD